MQHGTIFDYASWRGDIPFEKDGFNDVDNLVFSFLAYADFQNVKVTREENEQGITVREYYDRLMASGGFPKDLDLLIHNDEFRIIAQTKRFGDVLIRHYIDIVKDDNDEAVQFSAMDFCFGDHEHYIGFRGTDDSIAGWKEDMSFTYKKAPSQELAVDYLEEHIQPGETYYVGGHSKGGNLAIYGSAKLSDEKYKWVKRVYTNDAPGICNDVMDPNFLKSIDDKTIRIIPTYSMIGMCFPYPFSTLKIVHSLEKGLMQHNIKSWLVVGTELYQAKQLDPECALMDETLAKYIEDTKFEDREKIISDLFDAFDDSGKKKTVSSVRNGGLKELNRVLLNLSNKSHKTKETITRLPFTVWFGKTLMALRHVKPIDFLVHNLALPIGLLLICMGLLFLFVPFPSFPYFIGAIFIILTFIEILAFFYLMYLSHWNWKANQTRLYLSVIMVAVSISYFVSPDVMAGFSCIIFGILMMAFAFTLLGRMMDLYYKDNIFSLIIAIIECISMLSVGIYFIVINDYTMEFFALIVGWIFVSLGSLRMIEGIGVLIRSHMKDKS